MELGSQRCGARLLCFSRPILCFSRYRTVELACASAARPPAGAGTGGKDAPRDSVKSTPCVAQARLSHTRSFKLRAISNSYAPVIMRSPHPHF